MDAASRRDHPLLETVLVVVLAAALGGLVGALPLLARGDDVLHDLLLRASTAPPSARIVLLLVDDESLRRHGPWPFPWKIWARVVDELAARGAAWIAFDVVFAPRGEGDEGQRQDFGRSLGRFGRCVLPHYWQPRRVLRPETGRLEDAWSREDPDPALPRALGGFANVPLPGDEGRRPLRSVVLERSFGSGTTDGAFVWNLARRLDPGLGDRVDPRRPFLLRWRGGAGRFPRCSVAELLGGDAAVPPLAGKVVFVGAASPSLGDVKPTPLGALSGVHVQAHLLDGLLDGGPLRLPPPWAAALFLVLMAFPARLLAGGGPWGRRLVAVGLVASGGGVLAFIALQMGDLRLPILPMLIAVVLAASWRTGAFPIRVGPRGVPSTSRPVALQGASDADLLDRLRAGQREPALRLELLRRFCARGEVPFARALAAELDVGALGADELEDTGLALARGGAVDQGRRFLHELCRRDIGRDEARRTLRALEERLSLSAGLVTIEGIHALLGRRFEEVARVGEGASALVFRGRDGEGPVALKVYRPWLMRDVAMVERFRRERRVLEALHCPLVPAFRDAQEGRLFVLAMDWVEGENARNRIEGRGPLPAGELVELLRSVLAGLAHMHGRGFFHGDLKGENLILSPGGARLVDFGLAGEEGATEAGRVLGTPGMMAPECLAGQPRSRAVDLWALAALVDELGGAEGREALPERFRTLLRRCRDADPESRPTAGELLAGLG